MNLRLSGVGADPKKLGILGLLLAIAAYFYFSGSSSGPASTSISQPKPSGVLGPATSPRAAIRPGSRPARGQVKSFRNAGEFKPSLKPDKDEPIDRNTIDPTLHLDLLARLKSVKVEGGSRSVFDFGQAAPVLLAAKEPDKIIPQKKFFSGPMLPPEPPPKPEVVKPPPPPIPLKFYGFVTQTKAGVKRAFFLDGDEIFAASEGDLVKKRYKIVRIGVNSAVVEDTQFENHQQTLPLVEEVTG
jgi:hypothetical protein